MNRPAESDLYAQAGDWLSGTIRRNPEGLLLLAAGCALLMRSRKSSSSRQTSVSRDGEENRGYQSASADTGSNSNFRQGLSRAAEGASEYVADVKDRVSDTVSDYAGSVSSFAGDAGRMVSERSGQFARQAQSTMQGTMDRVLRDQPLAVAVAGLAAGVAVAAAFPATKIEGRAFGGAHEALTGAVGMAGKSLMQAAGKAGEQLKSAVAERGLGLASADGLKELANDVAETFTDAVSGTTKDNGKSQASGSSNASGSRRADDSSSKAPMSNQTTARGTR
jgi:hypothetical protein